MSKRLIGMVLIALLGLTGCPWPWGAPTTPAAPLSGRILDPEGKPAEGVTVQLNFTNATPFTNPTPFRTQAGPVTEAKSGSDGRFRFANPPLGEVNLEAVQSESSKAIRKSLVIKANTRIDVGDVGLQPTGTLSGRVAAPGAPHVTDFLGTDVFVPGTGYLAKTDRDGSFVIRHVPAGSFRLMAINPHMGQGELPEVQVRPNETTLLGSIPLSLTVPVVAELVPPHGGPGSRIEVRGANFGQSKGLPVQLSFNGIAASDIERASDHSLVAQVPSGAVSGKIVVTVGGVPSTSPVAFRVLKSLGLSPAVPTLVPMGGSLALSVSAVDTENQALANPSLSWLSSDPEVASITSTGTLNPKKPGKTSVSAVSGSLSSAVTAYVASLRGARFALGPDSSLGKVSMAAGPQGVIAVYASKSDAPQLPWRLSAQRFEPGSWSPTQLLLPTVSVDSRPCILWSEARNEFVLAFVDAQSTGYAVKLARLTPGGSPKGDPQLIASGLKEPLTLSMATSGPDTLVVWQESDLKLYAQVDRQALQPPILLALGAGMLTRPSAVWNGNAWWIAWEETHQGNVDIHGGSVSASGSLLKAVTMVAAERTQSHPSLAFNGTEMVLAWEDHRGTDSDIYAMRWTETPVGAPYVVVQQAGYQGNPSLIWNGDSFLLGWVDTQDGPHGVFLQRFDSNMNPKGVAQAAGLGSHAVLGISLGWLGSEALVGWAEASNVPGRYTVLGQRISP